MITTSYKEFADRAEKIKGTALPFRKIVDGISTEWKGEHIRFSKEEPKMWHCGTGSHSLYGRANYLCAIKDSVAYIGRADPEEKGARSSAMRKFIETAKKGDILFLHGAKNGMKRGKYTHAGIFTGDILSYKDNYNGRKFENPSEDAYPDGWKLLHPETNDKYAMNPGHFYLKVEEWTPLVTPFEMPIKRNATLFEVTQLEGYPALTFT